MQTPDTGYLLVIAEKPDAAVRIADALGKARRKEIFGAEFLEVEKGFDGSHYVVCSASGHLFGLDDPGRNRRIFPVFDVDWFPLSSDAGSKNRSWNRLARKPSSFYNSFAGKKIRVINSLAKNASRFVHACDYDIEGETIGANILQFACGESRSSVQRARFSTLTADEIRDAFSRLQSPDLALSDAGRMRHLIDFVWGVNVSRALTESVRIAGGGFRMLTMGRVQGPTLGFLVKREMEVMAHVPLPYWMVTCTLAKDGLPFVARYELPRIPTKKEAENLFETISKAKLAKVISLTEKMNLQPPPFPFNIGDLQKEAFRVLHLSPSTTLKIAEKLYLRALISYPRTDSQKLPPSIGYSRILEGLSRMDRFRHFVEEIETGENVKRPRQGPQVDPAHPAIFPTGEIPKNLERTESLVYDLVARRFLSAFSRDASVLVVESVFDIEGYKFFARGESVVEEGWMTVYPYYYRSTKGENEPPKLAVSDILQIVKAQLNSKHEEKPPRYTESSLISKMESEGIGTKSTRAETISTLISREYAMNGQNLKPTEFGMILIDSMRKYCPEIVDPKMTKRLEESIESIAHGEMSELIILGDAMRSLVGALQKIQENQMQIGLEFTGIPKQTRTRSLNKYPTSFPIGKCPVCKTGDLNVIRSFKTGKRFVGCSNYKNGCNASAPLPPKGIVRPGNRTCEKCKWPEVTILFQRYGSRTRARPWRLCPNPACPSKKERKLRQR